MLNFVMVPVPREHVLQVMSWVLFRTETESDAWVHDREQFRGYLAATDDDTRRLLEEVAAATLDGKDLAVRALADILEIDAPTVRATLDRIQEEAFESEREPMEIWSEVAVGLDGKKGTRAFVVLRDDLAKLVRAQAAHDGR
jgi:hypothetical protein